MIFIGKNTPEAPEAVVGSCQDKSIYEYMLGWNASKKSNYFEMFERKWTKVKSGSFPQL